MCVFLFFAGHDTTTHGIAGGLLALLRNPEQWRKLKSNPESLVGTAVEEALRYESPVPRAVRRTLETVAMGGREIPAGSMVVVSAERGQSRPRAFPEPRPVRHRSASRIVISHLASVAIFASARCWPGLKWKSRFAGSPGAFPISSWAARN